MYIIIYIYGEIATRGRESDKCGSEKRRQKERTSGKKTDRKDSLNIIDSKDMISGTFDSFINKVESGIYLLSVVVELAQY